jgi:hypothetical protein
MAFSSEVGTGSRKENASNKWQQRSAPQLSVDGLHTTLEIDTRSSYVPSLAVGA